MKKSILNIVLVIIGMTLTINAHAFSFRPQRGPQAQFAGYYMAVKQGFYKAEGIDLAIKDGGPQISGLQEINEGKTEFATAWLMSAIQMREKGQKIVIIGQIFQKPALVLMAQKSSGIESLEYAPSLSQGAGMGHSEYHQIRAEGGPETDSMIFNCSNLGLILPGDGIYVNESFYQTHKDVCKKFMAATMKGWKYALAHRKETAEYIAERANATPFKTTVDQQLRMLDDVGKLIDPATYKLPKIGFDTAIDALKSTRMISKDVDYTSFVADIAQ